VQRDPLRPEKQFGRAPRGHRSRQRVSQDYMDELIDKLAAEQSLTDQREIGGFQRRMRSKSRKPEQVPVLARRHRPIAASSAARTGRRGSALAIRGVVCVRLHSVFRRHQLGACEMGLEKLIRNHQPPFALRPADGGRRKSKSFMGAASPNQMGKIETAVRLGILDLHE
jgi:hypothetical protein